MCYGEKEEGWLSVVEIVDKMVVQGKSLLLEAEIENTKSLNIDIY